MRVGIALAVVAGALLVAFVKEGLSSSTAPASAAAPLSPVVDTAELPPQDVARAGALTDRKSRALKRLVSRMSELQYTVLGSALQNRGERVMARWAPEYAKEAATLEQELGTYPPHTLEHYQPCIQGMQNVNALIPALTVAQGDGNFEYTVADNIRRLRHRFELCNRIAAAQSEWPLR